MNTIQLTSVMKKSAKKGTHFLGVFACDQLPKHRVTKLPAMAIINTHPSSKPGEHWLAVYISARKHGFFFDSFGNPPDNFSPKIKKFLVNNCCAISFSSKQVQNDVSLACGQHCVFFLNKIQKGMSFKKILSLYSSNLICNDTMVCHFVKKIRPTVACKKYNFACIQCVKMR